MKAELSFAVRSPFAFLEEITMKKMRVLPVLVFLFALLTSACGGGSAASIQGKVEPWSNDDSIEGRRLALCKLTEEPQTDPEAPTDCNLIQETATSDNAGNFQFSQVASGTYFVFYDNNLSDFDAGISQWSGKTLMLSDVNWVLSQFCPEGESPRLSFLAGMSISRAGQEALVRGLYVCDAPFVIAIDPDKSFNAPLVLKVSGGETTVSVRAGSFSQGE
ncbi:MAG: hypothetical protein H6672_06975 [Anaerolineaceae bacterium]|nr:hypothetical protein [Anaerolineaceae bacterium]